MWIYILCVRLDRIYFAKTENWKHCSKIIFKYVNSIVKPIFNEKIAENWNLWIYKQCTDVPFIVGKSTFANTVQWTCMNSNHKCWLLWKINSTIDLVGYSNGISWWDTPIVFQCGCLVCSLRLFFTIETSVESKSMTKTKSMTKINSNFFPNSTIEATKNDKNQVNGFDF